MHTVKSQSHGKSRIGEIPHQALDPRLLGRPVHLLPQFADQLRDDLARALHAGATRRYWEAFEVVAVGFAGTAPPAQARWLGLACGAGTVSFAIGRATLLAILNYRYGRRSQPPAEVPDPAAVRVTATEERLCVVLGQHVAAVLARRIGANLAGAGAVAPAAAAAPEPHAVAAPAPGSWTIGVTLSDVRTGQTGQLWLAPDQQLMADLLQGMAPERARERSPRGPAAPLASALRVKLDGRLVTKEITLETLFALQVGDIIPVRLGRADVLLEESPLFTAAVSEHNGKLCLTSFEDTD